MDDIRIEDLVEKCARCNGTGNINERYEPTGSFGQQPESFTGPCPDCHGTRGKLTKSGEAIAEFVRFLKLH